MAFPVDIGGRRMRPSLDRLGVTVGGIEVQGFHGVYEEEARLGNRFRIDVEYEGEFGHAINTDDITETVDYDAVVQGVRDVNRRHRYNLIESLAGGIADELLDRFPRIKRVVVRVTKLAPRSLGSEAWARAEISKSRH